MFTSLMCYQKFSAEQRGRKQCLAVPVITRRVNQGQELASSVRNFLPSRESCRANSPQASYLSDTKGYQRPRLMQSSCISMRNTVNTAVSPLMKQKGSRGRCWSQKKLSAVTVHQRVWFVALLGVAKSSHLIATANKDLLMLGATIQVHAVEYSLCTSVGAESNSDDHTCRMCPLIQMQLVHPAFY